MDYCVKDICWPEELWKGSRVWDCGRRRRVYRQQRRDLKVLDARDDDDLDSNDGLMMTWDEKSMIWTILLEDFVGGEKEIFGLTRLLEMRFCNPKRQREQT